MPRLRDRNRYVVKFGLAHEGRRLDYKSIFEPLGVRSLELAVRGDGVICLMLTTDRCKTVESVRMAVKKYNESTKATQDGKFDLMCFSDDCDDTILTFHRETLYQSHPFYDHIKFAREQSLLAGDDSNYCMLVSAQEKRVHAKKSSVKKTVPPRREKIVVPEVAHTEWSEFHQLSVKCNFGVSDL